MDEFIVNVFAGIFVAFGFIFLIFLVILDHVIEIAFLALVVFTIYFAVNQKSDFTPDNNITIQTTEKW